MGRMKTILITLCISLGGGGAASAAEDVSKLFAACAGRYSAEIEHAWLVGTVETAAFETRRSEFVTLVEATAPPKGARHLLNHRIEAKFAQAKLLSLAMQQNDRRRARLARQLATAHLKACALLLLPG